MPESAHPALSKTSLSYLEERRGTTGLLTAAHEESLAEVRIDDALKSQPKTARHRKQNSDGDTRLPREGDGAPDLVHCRTARVHPLRSSMPNGRHLLDEGARIDESLLRCGMAAGICDAFAFSSITLEDLFSARYAKAGKKASCASPAMTYLFEGVAPRSNVIIRA